MLSFDTKSFYVYIKYVRYADNFMFGVMGKKKVAVQIKKKVINYIQNDLFLEINENKTMLTNVFNDSVSFLSCKIYSNKKNYFLFSKPQVIEKRLRTLRRIKIRKKLNLDRNSKKTADEIWNRFRSNPNKFLSTIHYLKNNDFTPIKEEILNALRLNRRKGIKELTKSLFSQIELIVPVVDKNTKYLFENIKKIEESLEDKNKQNTRNKKTEISTPLTKKYIVELIKKFYGDKLYINQYKTLYLIKKLKKEFPKLVWPLQIPFLIILPPNLNLKRINDKNKIKNLVSIIKFLKTNQHNFNKNIMINRIPKFNSEVLNTTQINEIVQRASKLTLNADLKNIYKKLKESSIIKKDKMKIETKKSVLLNKD